MAIELGLTGTARLIVTDDDTAAEDGTGDVPVLSTPGLLRVMQQATLDALDGHVPEGMITAAMRINLDHLHASPVGAEVTATATLIRIEGRRLIFEAEAVGPDATVGLGRLIRVLVDRDSFLGRLR